MAIPPVSLSQSSSPFSLPEQADSNVEEDQRLACVTDPVSLTVCTAIGVTALAVTYQAGLAARDHLRRNPEMVRDIADAVRSVANDAASAPLHILNYVSHDDQLDRQRRQPFVTPIEFVETQAARPNTRAADSLPVQKPSSPYPDSLGTVKDLTLTTPIVLESPLRDSILQYEVIPSDNGLDVIEIVATGPYATREDIEREREVERSLGIPDHEIDDTLDDREGYAIRVYRGTPGSFRDSKVQAQYKPDSIYTDAAKQKRGQLYIHPVEAADQAQNIAQIIRELDARQHPVEWVEYELTNAESDAVSLSGAEFDEDAIWELPTGRAAREAGFTQAVYDSRMGIVKFLLSHPH